MYTGTDWYITFGFVPFIVEFDEEAGLPRIRMENPVGAYPEFDRHGRCIAFAKKYRTAMAELCAQFPEHEAAILGKDGYDQNMNAELTIIRYYDKEQSVIYIPERNNLVVSQAVNPLKKMLVHIARRPSIDGQMRTV